MWSRQTKSHFGLISISKSCLLVASGFFFLTGRDSSANESAAAARLSTQCCRLLPICALQMVLLLEDRYDFKRHFSRENDTISHFPKELAQIMAVNYIVLSQAEALNANYQSLMLWLNGFSALSPFPALNHRNDRPNVLWDARFTTARKFWTHYVTAQLTHLIPAQMQPNAAKAHGIITGQKVGDRLLVAHTPWSFSNFPFVLSTRPLWLRSSHFFCLCFGLHTLFLSEVHSHDS